MYLASEVENIMESNVGWRNMLYRIVMDEKKNTRCIWQNCGGGYAAVSHRSNNWDVFFSSFFFFLDAWEYDEHFYSQPVEHCYIYEILVVYPQTFKGIVDTTCTHAYPFPDPQHNKKGEHR